MYIGIDLGGTNIAVGLVDNKGNIVSHASTPTLRERHWTEIVKDMAILTNKVTASAGKNLADIKVVGIGIPGNIDNERGIVVRAANVNMENVPLAAEFRKYIDIPVCLENDANAAAFGEYFAQDPRRDNFLMVTLGTGVGGGIVIKGKIFRGFNGAGGEIGHHVIHLNGEKCACGRCRCYEAYASVTALINQTKKKMRECPDSMMHRWVDVHGEISGFTAFDCASKGDKAALEVRDTYITYVAEGIVNSKFREFNCVALNILIEFLKGVQELIRGVQTRKRGCRGASLTFSRRFNSSNFSKNANNTFLTQSQQKAESSKALSPYFRHFLFSFLLFNSFNFFRIAKIFFPAKGLITKGTNSILYEPVLFFYPLLSITGPYPFLRLHVELVHIFQLEHSYRLFQPYAK